MQAVNSGLLDCFMNTSFIHRSKVTKRREAQKCFTASRSLLALTGNNILARTQRLRRADTTFVSALQWIRDPDATHLSCLAPGPRLPTQIFRSHKKWLLFMRNGGLEPIDNCLCPRQWWICVFQGEKKIHRRPGLQREAGSGRRACRSGREV